MKKKNNDPYEIAKISMFYNNFLYNEIVKRHIEEYKPQVSQKLQELVGKIKKYNQTKNNIYNYENLFNVVVGQALDQYRLACRGYKSIISDEVEKLKREHAELFNFIKMSEFYKMLLKISEEYNVSATEILFPVSMPDIVNTFSDSFKPPISLLFNIDIPQNFVMIHNGNSNFLARPVATLSEDDIDKVKFFYIVGKIIREEEICSDDKNIFVKHSSQNKHSDIRIDAFIKYIIGLYCWDAYKFNKDKKAGYVLYQKYKSNHNECKKSKCFNEMEFYKDKFREPDNSENSGFCCDKVETCKRFVREAFKLVSMCIKDCKLYNSKKNARVILPQGETKYERKKLSFFQP